MITPKNFGYKSLPGLSEQLLSDHFALYRGYIKRLNREFDTLGRLNPVERFDPFAYEEMVLEDGFLRNAIRLHELYFENLSPHPAEDPGIFNDQLIKEMNHAAEASPGWVVLGYDPNVDELIIDVLKDHRDGYVQGLVPLIVMDTYEHAYMRQYGVEKKKYIEAFWRNLDWGVVLERFHNMKRDGVRV